MCSKNPCIHCVADEVMLNEFRNQLAHYQVMQHAVSLCLNGLLCLAKSIIGLTRLRHISTQENIECSGSAEL